MSPKSRASGPVLRGPRNRGLTLVDVMVSLLIVCLLTGIALSQGGVLRAHDANNRVKCAANLTAIYKAMYLYANDNRGDFPRTVAEMDGAPTQYTGVDSKDPFAKDTTVKPNDVSAAMFLVLRTQDITADAFVCPNSLATPASSLWALQTSAADYANFKSDANLSYSLANPYPSKAALNGGYRWWLELKTEFALAADMNPGTQGDSDVTPAKGPKDENAPAELMRKANSANHFGAGQNVLYGDGHVNFESSPFVGMKRDNIYTASAAEGNTTGDKIAATPGWAGDSVLLPVASATNPKPTPADAELAAARVFKAQLPQLRLQLAAEEAGLAAEQARLKDARQELDALEKEVAQIEAPQKK